MRCCEICPESDKRNSKVFEVCNESEHRFCRTVDAPHRIRLISICPTLTIKIVSKSNSVCLPSFSRPMAEKRMFSNGSSHLIGLTRQLVESRYIFLSHSRTLFGKPDNPTLHHPANGYNSCVVLQEWDWSCALGIQERMRMVKLWREHQSWIWRKTELQLRKVILPNLTRLRFCGREIHDHREVVWWGGANLLLVS